MGTSKCRTFHHPAMATAINHRSRWQSSRKTRRERTEAGTGNAAETGNAAGRGREAESERGAGEGETGTERRGADRGTGKGGADRGKGSIAATEAGHVTG